MINVKGDMFEIAEAVRAAGKGVIIGHGCNRQGLMGAGVAALVRDRYPLAYTMYAAACDREEFGLGQAQFVQVDAPKKITIANMFTQDMPGPDAKMWAIERAILLTLKTFNAPVVIPEIGAGIGGLDRGQVMSVLEQFDDRLVVVTYGG